MTSGTLRRMLPIALALLVGCGGDQTAKKEKTSDRRPPEAVRTAPHDDKTEAEAIKSADVSVLYFGNSHTGRHDIPKLVGRLIQFGRPGVKYVSRHIGCAFLEDAANNPRSKSEIETHPWKFVVLQAQKISMSGKYKYSQKEGIDLAKTAKVRGAKVLFFSEWGRRDVPKDGVVQESIYQEMADAAKVRVAPVGRAWDIALEIKPSLLLYDADGNHESATGAFLTACVFYGLFTDSDPATIADSPCLDLSKSDRAVMANAASKVWKDERAKHQSSRMK